MDRLNPAQDHHQSNCTLVKECPKNRLGHAHPRRSKPESILAVLEFSPQYGSFLRTTVTFTLRALIGLHHLRPARGVAASNFLAFEFDSQFHGRAPVRLEPLLEIFKTMMIEASG
jgi:hypothetical protein